MSLHPYVIATLACLMAPVAAQGQTSGLKAYLDSDVLKKTFAAAEGSQQNELTPAENIRSLMPSNNAVSFVRYVIATRPALALKGFESLRLNKILENAAAAGGTSALSSAIGPALLGAAIEYGGVLQESTGTTTTLRLNALGITKLAVGARQVPYCPALDPAQCQPLSRWLRRVSASVSLEPKAAAADATGTPPPSAANLLGGDLRVSSWGARVELTPASHLHDPAYTAAWTTKIGELRNRPEPAAFTAAVGDLFGGENVEPYAEWRAETIAALSAAASSAEFQTTLDQRLQALIDVLLEADPSFPGKVIAASRAFDGYLTVRDDFIMQAQVHKAGLEYTNHSPLNQPATSNVRFIYSHQPTDAPLLFTLNAAFTAYNSKPSAGSQLRDVQLAGQIDRRLGDVPSLGPATLTLAAYYQWMKEDAVVDLDNLAAAALPSLVLDDDEAAILGTKGHIVLLQGKVSIAINDVLKVPFSVTWSNRRELIPDSHTVRGQVGLAIDLDGVFK